MKHNVLLCALAMCLTGYDCQKASGQQVGGAGSLQFSKVSCDLTTPGCCDRVSDCEPCDSDSGTFAPSRFSFFGEFLYLRAANSTTIDYAVPINGAIVPPLEPTLPVGPIATLNPDVESGVRVGGWLRMTCDSQLGVAYTHFESEAEESTSIDPANNVVLLALVVHPATVAANTFFDDASARWDLEYETVDIDYRHILVSNCSYRGHYVAGVRYLSYEEQFGARYTNAAVAENFLATNSFDGFGLRGGFEGEWGGQNGGLLAYGKLIGGAIAGELNSSYVQQTGELVVVSTSHEDNRIVPSIEAEVGLGWRSCNQRVRLSAGYNVTALFNLASANSLIHSVRTAQFSDSDDTFTLDGLVARAELAF